MKKGKWLILILLLAIGLGWYFFGCGKVSVEAVLQTQSGSVSGYVYDASVYDYLTRTFFGIPDIKIVATVAGGIPSQTYSATTDASGYYQLNNLPGGELVITAYKKGFYSRTIVTDRAIVNFMLSDPGIQGEHGLATIKGAVGGVPEGISGFINLSYSAYSKSKSVRESVTLNNNTYTIYSAPDDGETYLILSFLTKEASVKITKSAYGKVNTSPQQTSFLNLQFGNYNTLTGTMLPPAGFTYNMLYSCLYKGSNIFGMRGILGINYTNLNTFQFTGLPPLLAGDTYMLAATVTSDAGKITKNFYGYGGTNTNLNLDLSTLSVPTPVSPSPADDATHMTGLPSFAWNAVTGDNVYYEVYVNGSTPTTNVYWYGITTKTSITCPLNILSSDYASPGSTYYWYVSCHSFSPAININDIPGSKYMSASGDLVENFLTSTRAKKFSY